MCSKALLYYNPVAERVVASAQRLKGGHLIEKVRPSVLHGPRRRAYAHKLFPTPIIFIFMLFVWYQVRLSVENPRGSPKRGGSDDEVVQYYEVHLHKLT